MRILYLGDNSIPTTSAHRAEALKRLGHEVVHLYPRSVLPAGRIMGGLSVRIGFGLFSPLTTLYLRREVAGKSFDLAWIDGGAELGPAAYRWLKKQGMRIINYNVDDPFGIRDGKKWKLYRAAVPYHDLTAVVREENIVEAEAFGAKKVVRVFRSYDPVVHHPVAFDGADQQKWQSEVCFVGAWMPERGPLMLRLMELGVPLRIFGNRWEKAPEWSQIQQIWCGSALGGTAYVKALQYAKVTLGLLSKGNRDLHTQRSAEVPFIGGAAFCAERTHEHEAMYLEGREAEFWSTPEECAEKCFTLLKDEERRLRMVCAAKERVEASSLSNDAVMASVLNTLTKGN